jgi:hypothetical protein
MLNIHKESENDYFLSALNLKETVAADGYFVPACRFNQLKSCTSDQALACQSNGKTLLSTWWNFLSLAFRHGLSDMVFHISNSGAMKATFFHRNGEIIPLPPLPRRLAAEAPALRQKLDRNLTETTTFVTMIK